MRASPIAVSLVYGNRTVDSIIFREALNDLKDRYLGRLSVLHVLSRDSEADMPLLSGRIDGDKVKALLPLIGPAADIDHVYLCGPGNLIKEAREALLDAGVARERIHLEYFRAAPTPVQRRTPDPKPVAGRAHSGAEVVAVVDGVRHIFRVPEGAWRGTRPSAQESACRTRARAVSAAYAGPSSSRVK